jgi:hypothetical protein
MKVEVKAVAGDNCGNLPEENCGLVEEDMLM